jgi:predicted ATPase/class 3 adenylate cyclase
MSSMSAQLGTRKQPGPALTSRCWRKWDTPSVHPDVPDIQRAMAAVEEQRGVLGDATTEAALAPLRQALADRGVVPEGTRLRHLAVLFVDAVGSTSTGREVDLEDFNELMDHALRQFTTVIEAASGRVLKYMGDGLLAVWGSTRGSEADAENAVLAGLGLLDAARVIRATSSDLAARSFEVRVGINVGMVLVGGGIEGERHVSGTVVNVASRLEHAAPVGGLRISRATFELVRGLFEVIEDPATELKGISGTVPTYQVIRPAAGYRRVQRGVANVTTPMIARDDQLATLQRAYSAVADGEGPKAVIVSAEAGIGKSRLLREFTQWLVDRPRPPTVLSADAGPRSVHQPFGLIRNAVANFVGVSDSDPIDRARDQFAGALRSLFPSEADASEVFVLGHLIGFDFAQSPSVAGIVTDPEQVRVRGGRAMATMIRRLSNGVDGPSPVVLILDDLHWSEEATLDLLAELVNRPDLPLLLVTAARPELLEERADWVAAISEGDRLRLIRLDPLDEASAGELARAMLHRLVTIPPELEAALARADGNPFFMEELLRMMLTERVLEIAPDGAWELSTDRLRDVRLPGTLIALLQARVDALDTADRSALQRASVVGYVFWDRAVEALSLDNGPEPDSGSSRTLEPLLDRGLVIEHAESSIEDATEFTFRHHLLHQFTYSTLLRNDRQRYHALVAEWLDALASATGTSIPGLTADHYERAGLTDEAARRYAIAAEDASGRSAKGSALVFARRGLELVAEDDLATAWLLNAEIEGVMYHSGDRQAQRDAIAKLISLAETMDDPKRRAEAEYRHMSVLFTEADLEGTVTAGAATLDLAIEAGDTRLQARVLSLQSSAERQLGRLDAALTTSRRALEIARAAGDTPTESVVLAGLSVALTELGDPVGGRDAALDGLAISREMGDAFGLADGLNVAGYASLGLGDLAVARQQFVASHREAAELGWAFVEAASLKNLALVQLICAEYEAAATIGEQAATIALGSGSRDIAGRALTTVGIARGAAGDTVGARDALERAHAMHLEVGAPHCAIEAVAALAAIDLAAGDLDAAIAGVERVVTFLAHGSELDGVNEPFRPRWICWQVLRAAGNIRAGSVLNAAHAELVDRAGRISDEELRFRFLDAIPYHRDIITAWEREQRSTSR